MSIPLMQISRNSPSKQHCGTWNNALQSNAALKNAPCKLYSHLYTFMLAYHLILIGFVELYDEDELMFYD